MILPDEWSFFGHTKQGCSNQKMNWNLATITHNNMNFDIHLSSRISLQAVRNILFKRPFHTVDRSTHFVMKTARDKLYYVTTWRPLLTAYHKAFFLKSKCKLSIHVDEKTKHIMLRIWICYSFWDPVKTNLIIFALALRRPTPTNLLSKHKSANIVESGLVFSDCFTQAQMYMHNSITL